MILLADIYSAAEAAEDGAGEPCRADRGARRPGRRLRRPCGRRPAARAIAVSKALLNKSFTSTLSEALEGEGHRPDVPVHDQGRPRGDEGLRREARSGVHGLVIARINTAGGPTEHPSPVTFDAPSGRPRWPRSSSRAAVPDPHPRSRSAPDGQPDPVLELGRVVYGEHCANCHGNEGQGGRGKPINGGRALERFPDVADMIAVITQGKGFGHAEVRVQAQRRRDLRGHRVHP